MERIAGFIRFDQQLIEESTLEEQLASMKFTGGSHDATARASGVSFGVSCPGPGVGFVHCNKELGLICVAQIRFLETNDLRRRLSCSDDLSLPEILCLAYKKWGQELPTALDGEYALVVHDSKTQKVFACRDPLGACPLVYTFVASKYFAFASQVEGLLVLPDFEPTLDDEKIADFLLGDEGQGLSPEKTFYAQISVLGRGHSLTVKSDSINTSAYWSVQDSLEPYPADKAKYLYSLLEDSILRATTGFSKAGIALSGGVDSGGVWSILRYLIKSEQHSTLKEDGICLVSLLDRAGEANWEKAGIDSHFETFEGMKHVLSPPDSEEMFGPFHELLTQTVDPYDFQNTAWLFHILSCMKSSGVEVALTGTDGDMLCSGNPYLLADLFAKLHLAEAFRELAGLSKVYGVSQFKLLSVFGLLPLLPHALSKSIYDLRHKPSVGTLIHPEFVKHTDLQDRLQIAHLKRTRYTSANDKHASLFGGLLQAVRQRHDRIGSFFGIEVLSPLLSPELCRFCVSLPQQDKLYRGQTKKILREALAGVLDDSIRLQPNENRGVGAEFQTAYFKTFESQILGTIKKEQAVLSEFVSFDAVGSLVKSWQENPKERSEEPILRLYTLSKFLA